MSWSFQSLPELDDQQFLRWRALLEQRTGINFAQHKSILQFGLIKRMREINCLDYDQYYHRVSDPQSGVVEWTALLNSLTVGETSFFRQPEAFDFLKKYIVERLAAGGDERQSIELWSAGCSSGEEAYSLAMVANDCIEGLRAQHYFGVTGSDICLAALAGARSGRYRMRKLERINPALQQRYFEQENDNHAVVVPWLKRRVCFVQANLIELQRLPVTEMDVIFCQNVLVYFRPELRHQVLDRLVERLKPGGALVIGLGEAVGWKNPEAQRVADERIQAYIKQA